MRRLVSSTGRTILQSSVSCGVYPRFTRHTASKFHHTFASGILPTLIAAPSTIVRCAPPLRSVPSSLQPLLRIKYFPRSISSSSISRSTSLNMDSESMSQYLADSPPTIVPLKIKPHFDALSQKEKTYAHYISIASFAGTRVVLRQVSKESEAIYDLIMTLHEHCKGDWDSLRKSSGLSEEEMKAFVDYAAMFLGNLGNFKSFGDSQFIPRLPARQFKALATSSDKALSLYESTEGTIFGRQDAGKMHLGFPDAGHTSTYYPDSPTITKNEIEDVNKFLEGAGLLPENTRLRKTAEGDYEVLIASADSSPKDDQRDVKEHSFNHNGKTISLVYGDYNAEMKKIADALESAGKFAANEIEHKMMNEYVKSFRYGSLEAFKESQRYWIKDKGPMVESDIGFIESYRDPSGIRAEWEGFVAMVNQERTRAFSKLVESAPMFIPRLPWTKDFEKDSFLAPDFTSLEVLTFSGSGIPAGINIPNYDDIRQNIGFKNVSLGNVLSAKSKNEPIPFIKSEDLAVYEKYRDPAFEVQVGLHELLGHGCGKLLQETSPGKFNFDEKNPPISPLTNKPITSYYKPGQTWSSVFGGIAPSYEECRAECVAMSLSCDFEALQIFGFGNGKEDINGEAGDVLLAAYLSMARAGIVALEFWDPKSRKWGQAHMQARYSILRCFLDAGGEFCKLDYTKEDLSDLTLSLDRSKILSHGRPAVDEYLRKLHVYKATADVEAGTKMYNNVTSVDEFWATKVRPEVLRKKTPRKVYVQASTFLDGDKVTLKEYEPTAEGMIQSYAERTYI